MKKVLIIDEDNSTNSVIAKELIDKYLNGVKAYSAGINPIEQIDKNTIEALSQEDILVEDYKSVKLDELLGIEFNLVVAVSDIIKDIEDKFPKRVEVISVVFDELKGEEIDKYVDNIKEIKEKLLPIVRKKLS